MTQKPKVSCPEPYIFSGTLPLPGIDFNATITLEEFRRMSEQCSVEEYGIEENIFLKHTFKREAQCFICQNG